MLIRCRLKTPSFCKVNFAYPFLILLIWDESFLNLNRLQLDKVVVCMDNAIHPHASIIVRSNFHDGGKELLKFYVQEVFQP